MFADAYRDAFAAVGVLLRPEDGCPADVVEEAERRLGARLPGSVREYLLLAGREQRVDQAHNRRLPPDRWFADGGRVVLMEENQRVVYWGTPACREDRPDGPVSQGIDRRGAAAEWNPERDSRSTFLSVMVLWNASFGGAAGHRAVGYADETSAREALEAGWRRVGEVNGMRAYRKGGQAAGLVRWEDFVQKVRGLPPRRVHAAAATEADLDQVRAAIPAQWESWGD